MAIQALEVLSRLDAHCLPAMDPAIKRALILECAGKSHDGIARDENVSKGTVEHWLRVGMAEIALCLPGGVRGSKILRGYWVGKHSGDCLADTVKQIRARTA